MAEVTYYWDVLYSSTWTDPNNMIDGVLANFASEASDGDVALLISTTGPGTDLGTITKVELRCYGYGDGDDRIDLSFSTLPSPGSPGYQLTMPASENWSTYADVTDDPTVGGWTWTKIAELPVPLRLVVEFAKVAKGNTMYCAKVEIRVTYSAEPAGTVHIEKATGRRTQLANSFPAIKVEPATGRRGTDTSFSKFLVKKDDGRYTAE